MYLYIDSAIIIINKNKTHCLKFPTDYSDGHISDEVRMAQRQKRDINNNDEEINLHVNNVNNTCSNRENVEILLFLETIILNKTLTL